MASAESAPNVVYEPHEHQSHDAFAQSPALVRWAYQCNPLPALAGAACAFVETSKEFFQDWRVGQAGDMDNGVRHTATVGLAGIHPPKHEAFDLDSGLELQTKDLPGFIGAGIVAIVLETPPLIRRRLRAALRNMQGGKLGAE